MCVCVAVPTDDGRNSYVFNGARATKSTRTIFFYQEHKRQSFSCVLIPYPWVLPGSRVEFCQWCALVRCSPFCLTFLFVPFAPRHHRTSHHGISTHLLHFGVTGFLLSPRKYRHIGKSGGTQSHSQNRLIGETVLAWEAPPKACAPKRPRHRPVPARQRMI